MSLLLIAAPSLPPGRCKGKLLHFAIPRVFHTYQSVERYSSQHPFDRPITERHLFHVQVIQTALIARQHQPLPSSLHWPSVQHVSPARDYGRPYVHSLGGQFHDFPWQHGGTEKYRVYLPRLSINCFCKV